MSKLSVQLKEVPAGIDRARVRRANGARGLPSRCSLWKPAFVQVLPIENKVQGGAPCPFLHILVGKNRRTILKEAEQHVGSKYVDQVLDSLYVIEMAMRHFYMRAEMGKNAGRKEALVDQDYKDAATLAALVAPYRHARLSAMKLAGDPNNPARFKDDATADELRAEIMKRLRLLVSAGLIDLKALPVPDGEIGYQPIPSVDRSGINGQ